MPAEGVKLTKKEGILKTEEIIRISDLFVREGVRKIRLTGGEPTVRKDIIDIVGKIYFSILSRLINLTVSILKNLLMYMIIVF